MNFFSRSPGRPTTLLPAVVAALRLRLMSAGVDGNIPRDRRSSREAGAMRGAEGGGWRTRGRSGSSAASVVSLAETHSAEGSGSSRHVDLRAAAATTPRRTVRAPPADRSRYAKKCRRAKLTGCARAQIATGRGEAVPHESTFAGPTGFLPPCVRASAKRERQNPVGGAREIGSGGTAAQRPQERIAHLHDSRMRPTGSALWPRGEFGIMYAQCLSTQNPSRQRRSRPQ